MVIYFMSTSVKKEANVFFLWNGVQVEATPPISAVSFPECLEHCRPDGYDSHVTPITDTSGSIGIRSYVSFGNCHCGTIPNSETAYLAIHLPNPRLYYNYIYIANSGYGTSTPVDYTTIPNAVGSSTLSQVGGNSITLYSAESEGTGSMTLPSGTFMSFSGNYITMGASAFNMVNDNELILTYSCSSKTDSTFDYAECITNLQLIDIDYKYKFMQDMSDQYVAGSSFNAFITKANNWIG